jgi:hypothetical protein
MEFLPNLVRTSLIKKLISSLAAIIPTRQRTAKNNGTAFLLNAARI